MGKKNCWEVMGCGRQLGGDKSKEVCPASIPGEFNGVNCGVFGGRFCWAIVGTPCAREVAGPSNKVIESIFKGCIHCEFFKMVQDEESNNFVMLPKDARDQNDEFEN